MLDGWGELACHQKAFSSTIADPQGQASQVVSLVVIGGGGGGGG